MYRVEVTHLSKSYPLGNGNLTVLDDINFDLEDHSFVTVVGKSGCGKTTLLRIMCNLETASRGRVHFARSSDIESPPKVSIVFQEPRLMPWLTVGQNIAFSMARDSGKAHVRETLDFYLNLLDLM